MKIIATIKAATLNCHPKISTSTAQRGDGVCLPGDLCHRSLWRNRKAQLPVSISETWQTTPDQELLTSPMLPPLKASEEDRCCELLSYAARHTEHRPNCMQLTRGRTTSPTALQQHRSHTRATQEISSYRTDCHDSHILTANHFFLAMSPASRSQQMHSEPQLGIKNIQQ